MCAIIELCACYETSLLVGKWYLEKRASWLQHHFLIRLKQSIAIESIERIGDVNNLACNDIQWPDLT